MRKEFINSNPITKTHSLFGNGYKNNHILLFTLLFTTNKYMNNHMSNIHIRITSILQIYKIHSKLIT